MKVARTVLEDILNELLDKYSLNKNIAQTGQNYYINKKGYCQIFHNPLVICNAIAFISRWDVFFEVYTDFTANVSQTLSYFFYLIQIKAYKIRYFIISQP